MDEKQFKSTLRVLNEINGKLTLLVNFQKKSIKPPELGKEEKLLLKLCNGKNTVTDMTNSTKKTRKSIELILGRLRKKGMIRSTSINKKTVYVKI